ncbi:MAG: hypothetical protein U0903_22125 [Planctomycetales bacterium]
MTEQQSNHGANHSANHGEWNRRDFSKLALAALGGMISGCQQDGAGTPTAKPPETAAAKETSKDAKVAPKELHLCRGLNSCKGLGGGATAGKNTFSSWQGVCATVAEHSCGGHNDCKGFGGCGAKAGQNDCKGKGGCHVPLMEDAWKTVRTLFEKKTQAAGKKFGDPPHFNECLHWRRNVSCTCSLPV